MAALKILVIPGSLRTGSLNAKLAAVAAYRFAQAGAEVTRISLADFPLPIYDGDLQARSGVPKNAINLKRMIGAHHGVLIVTPEYNASIPPLVKNTIDWVTRVQDGQETRGQVFHGRPFAIAAAASAKGMGRCDRAVVGHIVVNMQGDTDRVHMRGRTRGSCIGNHVDPCRRTTHHG